MLAGCGFTSNQQTILKSQIQTPDQKTSAALPKISSVEPSPTATVRLITTTPAPPRVRLEVSTPTPMFGPNDAVIEWRLPDQMAPSGMSFVDPNLGWVVFNGDYFFKTQDGGATWVELPRLHQSFLNIQFVSLKIGWAVGRDGLQKTEDGGQSWKQIADARMPEVQPVMAFIDEKIGFVTFNTGLKRTTDGGKTWQMLRPEAAADIDTGRWQISSISFINAAEGWVLYQNCMPPSCATRLLKTEDGGDTFVLVDDIGIRMRPGHNIFFLDKNQGWWFGQEYGYDKTVDGGITWTYEAIPENPLSISSIQMFTDLEGIASGWDISSSYRGLVKTLDGGKSWEPLFPNLQPSRLVRYIDAVHGYGVGGFREPSAFLVTDNGGVNWKKIGTLPEIVDQIQFLDRQTAYAGIKEYFENNQDYLWRTKNGGISWEQIALPYDFRVKNFFFLNEQFGTAWDYQHHAVQTLDFGNTWQPIQPDAITLPLPDNNCNWLQIDTNVYHACSGSTSWNLVLEMFNINHFMPVSGKNAWILSQEFEGEPPVLLRTTDGGKTWEAVRIGGAYIQDMHFINMHQGWMMGWSIFQTVDGANTWQQMVPANLTTN